MSTNTIQQEHKRNTRTLKGLELKKAQACTHRMTMAEMGISSTNLLFNSELAGTFLSDEILDILGDDPEKDSNIMRTNVPRTPQTSTIAVSSTSGSKSLDLDHDDDEQIQFFNHHDLDQLDHIFSGSENIIQNLKFFIHDLKRWKAGFNIIKFRRAEHLASKRFIAEAVGSDNLTKMGVVRTYKKETRQRMPRRKPRTHTNALMA